MKRFLAAAVILVMTAAVIFIAGNKKLFNNITADTTENTVVGKKDVIYFWYTDERFGDYIDSAAVSFGEKEGVHVIPTLVPESHYLEQINEATVRGKQGPDVYMIGNEHLEKAYLSGLAAEVDDVCNICDQEHFPQTALDAVTFQSKKVAYPFYFDTTVLLYNETYLQEWALQQARRELTEGNGEEESEASENTSENTSEETVEISDELVAQKAAEYFEKAVPGTVEDLLNVANTFDVPEGVEGVMKWDVSDIFYNYWIVGNYLKVGGVCGDDKSILDIDNEQTVACLKVYQDLNQFFFIESDQVTYNSAIEDFMRGATVFSIASSEVIGRLENAKKEGTFGFDYGVVTMPRINEELDCKSLSVTGTVCVNGYSEQKKLANKFAAYLVDEYAPQLYGKTEKLAANLQIVPNDALAVYKMEYARSISLPKIKEIGNLWLRLENLFAKIWNGEEIAPLVTELAEEITNQLNQS